MFLAKKDKARRIFEDNVIHIRAAKAKFARGEVTWAPGMNCRFGDRVRMSPTKDSVRMSPAKVTFPDFETWMSDCNKSYGNQCECSLQFDKVRY